MSQLTILALSLIEGIGGSAIKQMLSQMDEIDMLRNLSAYEICGMSNIGERKAYAISSSLERKLLEAEEVLDKAEKYGVDVISVDQDLFPKNLKEIYDCPCVIYQKGNIRLEGRKVVSFVGTRKATHYGQSLVESLIDQIQAYDPVIVSGLAYGIDYKSHSEALKRGLSTIAVMASGLDIVYPSKHKYIAEEMLERGGWISEQPFGVLPDARRFPARNRIIAGLAEGTIVIEAAQKGGALITAYLANDYNREVFAVPGNLSNPYSKGCNELIKTHKAQLITNGDDIVNALNWDLKKKSSIQKEIGFMPEMTTEEKQIFEILKKKPSIHIDELSWLSEMKVSRLASPLLSLELKGIVKQNYGKNISLDLKYI